jgi:hypothetical protein
MRAIEEFYKNVNDVETGCPEFAATTVTDESCTNDVFCKT